MPIAPRTALTQILLPAWQLLPPAMSTTLAQVFVLTICLHEGGPLAFQAARCPGPCIANRWQVIDVRQPDRKGPARGIAQFEKGGVAGVMNHHASRYWLKQACDALGVPFTVAGIWSALASNDALAAVLARLLAFTDPRALPAVGDWEAAFAYYVRNWRPGAWTRGTTAQRAALKAKYRNNYEAAMRAAGGR